MPHMVPDHISSAMQALLIDAYKAGYAAGAEDMRARILNAATFPASAVAENSRSLSNATIENKTLKTSDRAPRGLVGVLIQAVLSEKPGISAAEVEAAVESMDNRVSPRSVGNELRRFENTKYRREGRSWYLKNPSEALPDLSDSPAPQKDFLD